LNSLPMGFYSAATIVDDAKRHGLEFRPIDVTTSTWDCTLEERAVRMGLRFVKGLRQSESEAIESARARAAFTSLQDFRHQTRLNAGTLAALSEAGALEALVENRRAALWRARGAGDARTDTLFDLQEESTPTFAALDGLEQIGWDYSASDHSARGHPLAPLRAELRALNLLDAHAVSQLPHGSKVRCAGMVICRQRPQTASGVVFMTLEDETGFMNIVLWPSVFDQHALIARTENFLAIRGKIQRQDNVVHVVVDKLWSPRLTIEPMDVGSRDFH
jgi:error-prone DNA polymerase